MPLFSNFGSKTVDTTFIRCAHVTTSKIVAKVYSVVDFYRYSSDFVTDAHSSRIITAFHVSSVFDHDFNNSQIYAVQALT